VAVAGATERINVMRDHSSAMRVTGPRMRIGLLLLRVLSAGYGLTAVEAAVLPEDRSDLMYHYYDGGGVSVSGPAVLVRKSIGDSVSVSGRYYVDTISSASIDVVTTASPYHDRREEMGVGIDYLHGNSLVSMSLTSSKENDYLADTYSINVSHELFDGLTTLSLGFSQGKDTVQRVDTSFEDQVNRYNYRIGLSQVLTRTLLLGLAFEDVAEEGYLNNPYRAARVLGAYLPERYPRARDSQAIATRLIKGFGSTARPLSTSVYVDYRYYRDTWDIRAHTLSLGLQRYLGDRWIMEGRARYYTQNHASFYSDNFPIEMTYMARDKELSTFQDYSLGVKFSWMFAKQRFLLFNRASLNLSYDYIFFNYDDFTDPRTGELYSFGANVLQFFITAWY
jgi:hypothetical protein